MPWHNRNVDMLRQFAAEQQLKYFYDVGTERYKGVCHIALPEEGHTRPGEVLLGTDSHTCTAGAFGEFATGIGNTDAGFVIGTGKLWLKVPPTMRFVFRGHLPPYLMAKDLILAVIGDIGCDGATYRAMEFDGDAVYALNIEERMTLCNMVIEAGGKNGIIAPDDDVELRQRAQCGAKTVRGGESDQAGASYIFERVYDVSASLEPIVAKPHSPDQKALVPRGARHETGPSLHRQLHRRQTDGLSELRLASFGAGRYGLIRSWCRPPARSPPP
jgi:3-isopropylmalate/(R)-2-methylmalate dehydratase large subunit